MRDIITKLEELNVEKPQLNEGLADMAHEAEKDHEVQMARSDCYKSAKYAVAIHKMLKDVSEMEGIDGWVAAKITKAADYLGSVKHYMEGQAMDDVELAVVPVAGDMTDAMTLPQESTEKVYENKASVKHVDKLLSLAPQRTPGDIICDIMHWAEANNMDIDDIVKQGKMYYNDDKFMRGDDSDEEVTEAEERDYICVHAKKGKYECSGTSSYDAAKKAAEHWGLKSTAGIDAHLADKEHTATESVEEVTEDREVMVRATNIDYDGPALDKLPTDVNVKVMVNPGDGEDEIFDMVADELEDRYGVKVSGFDMKMMEDQNIEEEARPEDDTYGGAIDKEIDKILGLAGNKKKRGAPMALPKPKPDVKIGSDPKTGATRGTGDDADYMAKAAAANMPAQQKQKMMNKAMQTNSKFSEWSKK